MTKVMTFNLRDLRNFACSATQPYDAIRMALTSLLVCVDAEAVQILSRILQDLDIRVESCGESRMAKARLEDQHFDAVLIDCQNESAAMELIAHLRKTPINHNAVAIAMVDGNNQVREILAAGANFILYKPISRERAAHSIRAASGLIRQERRSYPRIPVQAAASIAYAGTEDVPSTLQDLSEEGVRFQADGNLPPCCKVYFQFSLPGKPSVIRLSGEMMWQDSSGRAGLRFAHVPQTSRRVLKEWLQTNVSQQPETAAPASQVTQPTGDDGSLQLSASLGLMSASTADRRDLSRQACCLGAEVYRTASNVPHRCNLSDIGTGGCYVETTETFPIGTPLEIIVRTENSKLCIAGKVKSSNPGFGMGVQFILRNDEQRKQVQELIARAQTESKSQEAIP